MTSTVERRPLPRSSRTRAARVEPSELLRTGGIAAAWALGAGLVAFAVPVLLVWAADRRSGAGAGEASRLAAQLWLLAHGTPLRLPSGVVGLVPLGMTALPLALLHRAGRHSASSLSVRSGPQAARLVAAIAVPYAAVACGLAALLAGADAGPVAIRALGTTLLVAAVGAGAGVLRDAGLMSSVTRFFPERVRAICSAAATACGVLLAAGVVLVIGSLLMHLSRVSSLAGATGPGLVGGSALAVLQLLLLPNAAVWGAGWLAGPGFAVGAGTTVSPWAVSLGNVPSLPVLGALPSTELPTSVALLALCVPVGVGVLAGVLVGRRLGDRSWADAGWDAGGIGLASALGFAMLALLSGGPLGSARLSAVGPSAWQVGLALLGEVTLGAFLALAATHARR